MDALIAAISDPPEDFPCLSSPCEVAKYVFALS